MRGEPLQAGKTKIIIVIMAGKTCAACQEHELLSGEAERLLASTGCPWRWQGRGQGIQKGEEHWAEGFPAWQDEGCGPAGQTHRCGHCAMKEAVCANCTASAPCLTWLSPCSPHGLCHRGS